MYKLLVIALIAEVSVAVVTKNSKSDEPTTLPTNLFKPLTPLKDNSPPTSRPAKLINPDNNFGEEFGSSSYTVNNKDDVRNDDNGKASLTNFLTRTGYMTPNFSILQSQNLPQLDFQDISAPFPYQLQSAHTSLQPQDLLKMHQDVFRDRIDKGFPTLSNFDTDGGDNHYQITSSHTYYNSDTMDAPMTQHYRYDSRNGESMNTF